MLELQVSNNVRSIAKCHISLVAPRERKKKPSGPCWLNTVRLVAGAVLRTSNAGTTRRAQQLESTYDTGKIILCINV